MKSARKPQPITINTTELEDYLDRLVEKKIKQALANLNLSSFTSTPTPTPTPTPNT